MEYLYLAPAEDEGVYLAQTVRAPGTLGFHAATRQGAVLAMLRATYDELRRVNGHYEFRGGQASLQPTSDGTTVQVSCDDEQGLARLLRHCHPLRR